jgi:hypothetical protein
MQSYYRLTYTVYFGCGHVVNPFYKENESKQEREIYHLYHHNSNNNVEFVVAGTIIRLWPWRLLVWGSAHGRFSWRSEIPPRQLNNSEYLLSDSTSGKKNASECYS